MAVRKVIARSSKELAGVLGLSAPNTPRYAFSLSLWRRSAGSSTALA